MKRIKNKMAFDRNDIVLGVFLAVFSPVSLWYHGTHLTNSEILSFFFLAPALLDGVGYKIQGTDFNVLSHFPYILLSVRYQCSKTVQSIFLVNDRLSIHRPVRLKASCRTVTTSFYFSHSAASFCMTTQLCCVVFSRPLSLFSWNVHAFFKLCYWDLFKLWL